MQVADITRCGWKINNGIVSIDWDSDSNLAAINEKVILLIVRRHSLKFHKYYAFCDKSTKLAIHVTKGVTKRFGYWATS